MLCHRNAVRALGLGITTRSHARGADCKYLIGAGVTEREDWKLSPAYDLTPSPVIA